MKMNNVFLGFAKVPSVPGKVFHEIISAAHKTDARDLLKEKILTDIDEAIDETEIQIEVKPFKEAFAERIIDNRLVSFTVSGPRASETVKQMAAQAQFSRIPFYLDPLPEDEYSVVTQKQLAIQFGVARGSASVVEIPQINSQVEVICNASTTTSTNNPGLLLTMAIDMSMEFHYRPGPKRSAIVMMKPDSYRALSNNLPFAIKRSDNAAA